MTRHQQWAGLVTYVSPYLIPPGGTQSQTNLHCRRPGELRCREGMSRVSHSTTTPIPTTLGVFSVPGTTGSQLLLQTHTGELTIVKSPHITPQSLRPLEPPLVAGVDQTQTNYLWQYAHNTGATHDLIYVFDGGTSTTSLWDYQYGADIPCNTTITDIPVGDAPPERVVGVDKDDLCEYP